MRICSIDVNPDLEEADSSTEEEERQPTPDSWEENIHEETCESSLMVDEAEIKELENKLINNDIHGSIIKVVSSNEDNQTFIKAAYIPNIEDARSFFQSIKYDQSNAGQIIFDQLLPSDDDDTPVVNCEDDDGDNDDDDDDETIVEKVVIAAAEPSICTNNAEVKPQAELGANDTSDDELPSLEEIFFNPATAPGEAAQQGLPDPAIIQKGPSLPAPDASTPSADVVSYAGPSGIGGNTTGAVPKYSKAIPPAESDKEVQIRILEKKLRAKEAELKKLKIRNEDMDRLIKRHKNKNFKKSWKLNPLDELGIPKLDMERAEIQNDVYTEILEELGKEAIAQTRMRSKDETFMQAAKKMGIEGVHRRRFNINLELDKEWEDAWIHEPTLEMIKQQIVDESKQNHEDYIKRAERVAKISKEKYLPKDWARKSDDEDEDEEHHQAQSRVRLMYDNIFGDALSFDPVLG